MPDILHQVSIAAPLARVHEAFATPEGLRSWWTTQVSEEHGILIFGFSSTEKKARMRVTQSSPRKVSWLCLGDLAEWKGTKIDIEFLPDDGLTVVKFSHLGWEESSEYFRICNAQWGFLLLGSLKPYVEQGAGNPMR